MSQLRRSCLFRVLRDLLLNTQYDPSGKGREHMIVQISGFLQARYGLDLWFSGRITHVLHDIPNANYAVMDCTLFFDSGHFLSYLMVS